MFDINTIPTDVMDEIRFMLGSIEECSSDYLKPVLEDYYQKPWEEGNYFILEPEDLPELTEKIYKELFLTGICKPFK